MYTDDQIKQRQIFRIAQIAYDRWEDKEGFDTNLFGRILIHDRLVMKGHSTNGGTYREHVVPRVVLRDECLRMFDNKATVEDVASAIMRNLIIVQITAEEAYRLDHQAKLKRRMPDGWVFGRDDPFDRIRAAGIKLVGW